MNSFIVMLLGAVCGLGVWVILMTLDGQQILPGRDSSDAQTASRDPELAKRFGVAVATSLIVGLLTWPVMGLVFGVGVFVFWNSLGSKKQTTREAEKADAIASWTEDVYSSVKASNGLLTSVANAAAHAHPTIREPALRLATDLQTQSLSDAITRFADGLEHREADSIAMTMVLSEQHGSRQLTELLKMQAVRTRAAAKEALEISASRQQSRTSVKAIVALTAVAMVGFGRFGGNLMDYYDTGEGQVALLASGAIFFVAFAMFARLTADPPRPRYFYSTNDEEPS